MAKITCCKSGIQFNVEHFPIQFSQDDAIHHPIFNAPLKRLFRYFPKWQASELTETDSYLYFLALLNSTEMVDFRSPASFIRQENHTNSIISSNMELLFYTIGRVVTIKHPRFIIPRFVVSKETASLSNVKYWIEAWEESYTSFKEGIRNRELKNKLQIKESALEKLIKNQSLHPEKYVHVLATWAEDAASFPTFSIKDDQHNETTINEYWKKIIRLCYQKESLLSIPEKDIQELLDHCENNLELGSIQSYHLFNTIKEGLDTVQGFYGIDSTSFAILDDDENTLNDAQLQLLVNDAPKEKPIRTAFATEFAFFKAMSKWNLSQKINSGAIIK